MTAAELRDRWQSVMARIEKAALASGRKVGDIVLLPVSKGQDADKIRSAIVEAGFPHALGENYSDELVEKAAALADIGIEWHYQGALQSRKIKKLAQVADVLQTVARREELEVLARLATEGARVPNFFVQVNVSGEMQKNGCKPDALSALSEEIAKLKLSKNWLGLMTVAHDVSEVGEARVRAEFAALRDLRDRICPKGQLSMGMSGDLDLAIREGATMVRVGSDLFGARN